MRPQDGTEAEVEVRAFAEGDLDSVVALSLEAWRPVYASFEAVLGDEIFPLQYPDWRASQRKEVEAACTAEGAHAWVAVAGGRVAGFTVVVLQPEDAMGHVELLAVHPDFQGRRIGTVLTEFAVEWMREAGVRLASIWTGGDVGHAPARKTYERAGFSPLPLVRYYKALDPVGHGTTT
ncbi:GNAT family N-acetyltransferase [Streptomyces sp. cmx-18-6]|uniref:GNAT family N-acetyltransferase n=1 Tax=Streptomyces sp. cmx-18-6 TaxID=2790930 RepID=UPI00397F495B